MESEGVSVNLEGRVQKLEKIIDPQGEAKPDWWIISRIAQEMGQSDFRYKKIGIHCYLKNDLFTLRGTIREKGKEYLVKRSWIFGISVINKKPENQISFKDMISRLKRIGRSQNPND